MQKRFLFSLFLLFPVLLFGQIVAPDTACINTPVSFTTPYPATAYSWVFDTVNINQAIPANTNSPLTGVSIPSFATMNNDNGHWYSFITNYSNNVLTRLDFGTNPNGAFTSANLGAIGSGGQMQGIAIVKDIGTGNWYGFIVNNTTLSKLSFGTSLGNTPTVTSWSLPANLLWPHQLRISKYGTQWIGFIGNRNGGITRLDFGTSISNTPTLVNLPIVGSMANPCNFAIHQQGGNYYMLVTNLINATLTRVDFGNNIQNNAPTGTSLGNPGGYLQLPRDIMIVSDCNQLIAYIQNENSSLTKLNFNGSITNTPVVTSLGSAGVSQLGDLVPYVYNDTLRVLSTSYPTNKIYRRPWVAYPSPNVSAYYNPSVSQTFTTPGLHHVTLYADHGFQIGQATFCKDIYIKSSGVGNIINDTNICPGETIILDASSSGGTSYSWNTGAITSSIAVAGTGKYWVTVGGTSCGSSSDTANVTAAPPVNVDLGNDTGFCNDVIPVTLTNLDTTPAGATLLWNTGASSSSIQAAGPGTYWLKITTSKGCIGTDSMNIKLLPVPYIKLGNDTGICPGTCWVIKPDSVNGATSFSWSPTGDTQPNTVASTAGTYKLTVSNSTCSSSDSIIISYYPAPAIDLGKDTAICVSGDFILRSEQPEGSTWLWNTGAISSSIKATAGNIYWLAVTNAKGCTATDSIKLDGIAGPYIDLGPRDTMLCNGEMVMLPFGISARGDKYLWSDGSTEPRHYADKKGKYSVQLSNQCGTAYDTITIDYKNCSIWFPSAFTPNGDGRNDIARVLGTLADVNNFHLSIFNRWGQRVFDTENVYQGWDGTHNGSKARMDTYYYIIRYRLYGNDQKMEGDITLVR